MSEFKEAGKGFELHVSELTISSSVVSVHWCITPELLAEIKQREEKQYVVLVTTPKRNWNRYRNNRLEVRKAVELTDLMTFVDFNCEGEAAIIAFIVDSSDVKSLIRKDSITQVVSMYDRFAACNINDDGSFIELDEPGVSYFVEARYHDILPIIIPEGVFAPDPPEWEQAWVNYWFESSPHEQCNYRKRRLLAYSIQLVWGICFVAFRVALAAAWLLAGFNIGNWKALYNIINYSLVDLISKDDKIKRWFVIPFLSDDNVAKHLINIANPLFWCLNLLISITEALSIFAIPKVLLISCMVILIAIGIAHAIKIVSAPWKKGLVINSIFYIVDSIAGKYDAWEHAGKVRDKALLQEDLLCQGQQYATVADLPRRRRTVKLRFESIKAKICRPYSK